MEGQYQYQNIIKIYYDNIMCSIVSGDKMIEIMLFPPFSDLVDNQVIDKSPAKVLSLNTQISPRSSISDICKVINISRPSSTKNCNNLMIAVAYGYMSSVAHEHLVNKLRYDMGNSVTDIIFGYAGPLDKLLNAV